MNVPRLSETDMCSSSFHLISTEVMWRKKKKTKNAQNFCRPVKTAFGRRIRRIAPCRLHLDAVLLKMIDWHVNAGTANTTDSLLDSRDAGPFLNNRTWRRGELQCFHKCVRTLLFPRKAGLTGPRKPNQIICMSVSFVVIC